MNKCKLCGNEFSIRPIIEGKRRNFQRRKYCLDCSPFGSGNTAKLSKYGETFEEFINKKPERDKLKSQKKNKEIYRKYQKQKREIRKQELVNLRGGKCSKCGYNSCIACLDFHHRNPDEKEFEISNSGLLLKWGRLVKEVEKCDVLCKNCHNEYHFLEKRGQ